MSGVNTWVKHYFFVWDLELAEAMQCARGCGEDEEVWTAKSPSFKNSENQNPSLPLRLCAFREKIINDYLSSSELYGLALISVWDLELADAMQCTRGLWRK